MLYIYSSFSSFFIKFNGKRRKRKERKELLISFVRDVQRATRDMQHRNIDILRIV